MSLTLPRSDGGVLTLPDRASLLVSRENGGNLVVNYQIVSRTDELLRTKYGLLSGQIARCSPCDACGYPAPVAIGESAYICVEYRAR
jgi:hypothetical protein